MTHTPSRAVHLIRSLLQIGPLLMLAACGGSGSSSSTSTTGTTTTTTTTTTAPGTPTLDSATAGDAQAVLAFTASTSGGTATSYSGSCSATGATTRSATGTGSPLTVTSLTNGTTYSCTVTATNSAGSSTSSAKTVTPAAASSSGGSTTVDTTALPVGTSKVMTVPTDVGYLYSCGGTSSSNPGNTAQGWISSDGTTWNLQTKSLYTVSGTVSWTSTFTNTIANAVRSLAGNGLPSHTTGTYPITNATSPLAYQYDHNPNSITTNTVAWSGLPTSPTVNATPTCLSLGAVGVFLTGSRMYAAFDAKGRDARAWEVTDACEGHPAVGGAYHYHSMPKCGLTADVTGQHSAVIGYAADGFAIYGMQGDSGKTITNADLDVCHGHTDTSVTQYHYHTTETFPYTIGCYRGTPISSHD